MAENNSETGMGGDSHSRRRFTRVNPHMPVNIEMPDGTLHEGLLADISYGGLFVSLSAPVRLKGPCTVEIILDNTDNRISIQGEIVRQTGDGVAIQKIAVVGLEAHAELRNLLAFNSDDVQTTEKEIDRFLQGE